MAMNDCPNRKACDRCHNQKLSCKRFGEEPCERCVRLRTECKSSPSLRYRKQANNLSTTPAADAHAELMGEGPDAEGGHPSGGAAGGAAAAAAADEGDVVYETMGASGHDVGAAAGGGEGGEGTHHESRGRDQPQVQVQAHPQAHPQVHAHAHTQGGGVCRRGARSPKRKRTESDNRSVPPDFGESPVSFPCLGPPTQPDGFAEPQASINIDGLTPPRGPSSGSAVAHTHDMEPVLDMTGFGYDHSHSHSAAAAAAIFPPHGLLDHHLSDLHPLDLVGHFISTGHPAESWDQHHLHHHHHHQLPLHQNTSSFLPNSIPLPVLPSQGAPLPQPPPPPPSQKQSSGHKKSSDRLRVTKATTKPRSRQIVLKSSLASSSSSPSTSSSTRNPPTTHWMPRLSDINTRLFELSSILTHHLERVDGGHSSRGSNGSRARGGNVPFPVDEMFKLSQQFAEAVQDVTQAHRGMADPGSSMFILSTYVRLLDMYQKVFSCIHSRLAQLAPGDRLGFRHWKLPDVTVGSFAVESTPSLQMSLTIQLAEEFLGQLRGAVGGANPSMRPGQDMGGGGADGSMFSGVVDVSFQAIRSREDGLGQQLTELRQDLEMLLDA